VSIDVKEPVKQYYERQ